MTDEQAQAQGVVANVAAISTKLISTLPPALLIILALNLCFVGSLFWLLSAQNASRERALLPLLESCSHTIPLEAMKYFAPSHEPPP